MGPVAAVIGAVSGVVGAVGAIQSAAAQRRAVDLQERQQELATRRSRRQAIRQAQIARSNAISAGANLGGLQGSSLQGGLSSLGSQVGAELGFSSQMSGLSKDISSAQRSAARWGAISQLGFGLFNAMGGFQGIAQGLGGGGGRGATTPAQATGGGGYISRPFGGSAPAPGVGVRPANIRAGTYQPVYAPLQNNFYPVGYGPQ
jgi:hypothetical protein